jgi:hypothetical protein
MLFNPEQAIGSLEYNSRHRRHLSVAFVGDCALELAFLVWCLLPRFADLFTIGRTWPDAYRRDSKSTIRRQPTDEDSDAGLTTATATCPRGPAEEVRVRADGEHGRVATRGQQ